MPSLDVIFAWIIAVLAGLACIGALAVVLVAEWYAIRRTIQRHHRRHAGPPTDTDFWRQQRALNEPR
jgi:O-antigen ligase